MFPIFHYLRLHIYFLVHIGKTLTVLRVGIFGAAHGLGDGGKANRPTTLNTVAHILNDETWLYLGYTLPKEDSKNI